MSFFRNPTNRIDSDSINSDQSIAFLGYDRKRCIYSQEESFKMSLYKDSQRKQLVCFYKVEKITTMFPTWEVKNQGWGAIEKLSLLQVLP